MTQGSSDTSTPATSQQAASPQGDDRPVASYAALTGVYSASVLAFAAVLKLTGRQLPERVPFGDIALMAVATHKLSRRMAKDKATSFLREPFMEHQEPVGAGEVMSKPAGHGPRRAVGELLACPFCLSQWIATGFTYGQVLAPRATRLTTSPFTAMTVADFLQYAYAATQQKVEG